MTDHGAPVSTWAAPVPIVLRAVGEALGMPLVDGPVNVLPTLNRVRTVRAGAFAVRFSRDPAPIAREIRVLRALETAVQTPIAPVLHATGASTVAHATQTTRVHWLVYPWADGPTLTPRTTAPHAAALGALLGALHHAHMLDVVMRLDKRAPLSLMRTYQAACDAHRVWAQARVKDGLGQDALSQRIADIQRELRPFVRAQERVFIPAKRRVVCHGNPVPSAFVLTDAGLRVVAFEDACAGEPSAELARLALAANLDPLAENAMLDAYRSAATARGRSLYGLEERFFASKAVLRFARPMHRLARLVSLRDALAAQGPGPRDAPSGPTLHTLRHALDRAAQELAPLLVPHTPERTAPRASNVTKATGRLLVYEDLVLRTAAPRIALTGGAYAGKSQLGSALARRLRLPLVNTTALSRVLALLEYEHTTRAKAAGVSTALSPERLLYALDSAEIALEPRAAPPYYAVHRGTRDITGAIHDGAHAVRAAALLDDPLLRDGLAVFLRGHAAGAGMVVEGPYAAALAPGARVFHVDTAHPVRVQRLLDHRPDIGDAARAEGLLAQLDAARPVAPDAIRVDVGSRAPESAALSILWHLLPTPWQARTPRPDADTKGPVF